MKIEIHINDQEIQDIAEHLQDQGINISFSEIQSHYEEYFHGYIEDFKNERMDTIVDSIIDLQAWFL